MNIKLTDQAIRYFLDTTSTPEELGAKVSLCGPTFDNISKVDNDYLYEIEIITNRIDTASAQGVARESSAILNQMGIKSKLLNDPYKETINLYNNHPKTFTFEVSNEALTPKFTAVSLENITIAESSPNTKKFLSLCGQRPINNAVDITNELTILYGMPSHIFDLDKLAAQKLIIRESKKDEVVITLDNKKNQLMGGDIIIEDGANRIVDLCGVMGGKLAEVDEHTKNILLVVPTYHPNKVRRTSLYLQNRTMASQIYEKRPDPQLCLPILMKAIKLFEERVGASVSSTVYDSHPEKYTPREISLDLIWVNKLIGIEIPYETTISILQNLGFETSSINKSEVVCTIPSWRQYDIEIKEDFVEEISRVFGYSNLPPTIPCVNLPPEHTDRLLKIESRIKYQLSGMGFNEIYNSSLISREIINKTKLQESSHLKLSNALTEDYEYLRISLVPSLLENIKNNQGKTDQLLYLFELSNVYLKTKDKLPNETSTLSIATTLSFSHTKGNLETLLASLNIKQFDFQTPKTAPEYFTKNNTAEVIVNGQSLGFIGTIKPSILHEIGIISNPTIIELNLETLVKSSSENYIYSPISEYPEIIEEMTISSSLKVGEIMKKIKSVNDIISSVDYINSYQNKHSFKISFVSQEKNLSHPEIEFIKREIESQFI